MRKSFKTEINPTPEQKQVILRTIGVCRFVYNLYIETNQKRYQNGEKFMSGMTFSVWLNDEYLPANPEKSWIKEVSSKAIKKAIMNAERAFKRFFEGKSGFPKFKKKGKSDPKRKYESFKKRNLKGEATRQNIQKQRLLIQRIYYRLNCIRTDYLNKTIAELVRTKPAYIAIEDLNVRGMMKNKYLSKAVSDQKFSEFRAKLTAKCAEHGIELRIADRFYPSSKTCHRCGCIKRDLKLKDKVYSCVCGYVMDRDLNAALNLKDTDCYKIA